MNNACPECGAVYAVAEKDIGRRISCKKCSTALIVAEEGLRRDDSKAAVPPKKDDTAERERIRERDEDDDWSSRRKSRDDDDDRSSRRRGRDDDDDRGRDRPARKRTGPGAGEMLSKLKKAADVATWLYGIGLFLTVYSFFSSRIDEAKEASRRGALIEEGIDMESYRRSINEKPDGKPPTEDERKKLEEKEKDWKKRQNSLNDDVKYAQAGLLRGAWWTVMFRMLGFFLLAFGSIGFLSSEQSQFKRILGGATILLILLQVIGGGLRLDLSGGPGGPGPHTG